MLNLIFPYYCSSYYSRCICTLSTRVATKYETFRSKSVTKSTRAGISIELYFQCYSVLLCFLCFKVLSLNKLALYL